MITARCIAISTRYHGASSRISATEHGDRADRARAMVAYDHSLSEGYSGAHLAAAMTAWARIPQGRRDYFEPSPYVATESFDGRGYTYIWRHKEQYR